MWRVNLGERTILYCPPATFQCIIDTKIFVPKQAIFVQLLIYFG